VQDPELGPCLAIARDSGVSDMHAIILERTLLALVPELKRRHRRSEPGDASELVAMLTDPDPTEVVKLRSFMWLHPGAPPVGCVAYAPQHGGVIVFTTEGWLAGSMALVVSLRRRPTPVRRATG
jgi:hypothetical protein